MDIDTSSRKEQRNFGLVMAAAITVLGMVHWWRSGVPPVGYGIAAAAFLITGLVLPRALQPVLIVWLRLALVLNAVVTHVLLAVVYVFMITPTGLAMRIFSDDPLKRDWDPAADSYWEPAEEQPEDLEQYKNQF